MKNTIILFAALCLNSSNSICSDINFNYPINNYQSRSQYKLPPRPNVALPIDLQATLFQLSKALNERNSALLEGMLDENIIFSLGPTSEKPALEFLGLNVKSSSEWEVLQNAMKSKGDFMKSDPTLYCIPYTLGQYEGQLESGPNSSFVKHLPTFMYQKQLENSLKIADISYEIVEIKKDKKGSSKAGWIKVKAQGGISGYTQTENLHFYGSTVICLKNFGDGWKITYLLSGE